MSDRVLVDTIVRAVIAQLGAGDEPPCACHQAPGGCCPDRMGRLLGQGAARFGLQAGGTVYSREIARTIDHTLLKAEATRAQIEQLCAEAREHGFATVCVNPTWVPLCAELLRGSETRVCTVVGFPLGATLPEVKAFETARTVAEGACEVDMVLNIGALKSGDYRTCERDVAAVVEAGHGGGAIVKVIIEAALLTDDEKVKACVVSKAAGADFVGTDYIQKIKDGWLDCDVIVATPDVMGQLGALGKILGPRGLMPNPKAGTVTMDVGRAIKELKAGKIEFRVDKAGIVHAPIGKKSFTADALEQNLQAFMDAIVRAKPAAAKGHYVRSVTVSSTMGPGVALDPAGYHA